MSRDTREAELKLLAEQDKDHFLGIYKRSVAMPGGAMPEEGMSATRMIVKILDHEFPKHPTS